MGVASELAVRFTADTSGLEAGGQKAEGLIGRMTSGLGKLGLAGLGLGAIKSGIEGIASAAVGLVEGNAEFERYNTQLTTLMGSASAAKDRMAELAEFGAKTPFELPEIVRADKVLTGFGLTTEKTMKIAGMGLSDFRAVVGDVAAGTGASFEEIALTFGKFSAGATGESIARLQELGVVTKEQMAAVGITFSKSGELTSPLPEAFAAATKIAAEKFGGGMDALSNTFEGKLSTLADTWAELKRTLAAPLFDVLKGQLDVLQGALAQVPALLEAFKTGFADAGGGVEGLWGGLIELAAALGVSDSALTTAIDAYGVLRDALIAAWASVQPLIDAVSAAAAKFTEFAGGPGKLMTTVIGTVLVAAFVALAAAALSAAAGIIAALAPILIPIGLIVAAVVVLRKAWDTNFGGIREKTAAVVDWITTNVGPAISSMVETVKAVLGGMADWWASNGDMIIGIVKGIWDTVAGLFQVAFATIKGLVSIFLNAIHGNFEGAGKALISMWGGVGAGLVRAFKGLAVALLGTIATLTKNTVEAFIALGGMIITGLINGLKNAPGVFADFMAGMAKAAIAAFKKQFGISSPSKVMKGLGGDVIAGLVVGLTERASDVHGAISAIASGLIDAARGALDSHSPSRAFADIGGDVVAGLDEGLAGMRDSAARLASDVSGGVGGAADAAITAAARFAEIGDISVTIDAQPLMQAVDGMKKAAGDLRQSLLDLQPVATDTGVDIGTLASGANIINMFEQLADRGVALVPALASIGAMAVEAAGASGLGALAAALTGPVALAIGGAIAIGVLLYKAWETNFGGIRDKVLEVTAIVQAKWTEVRAKLGAVFGEIWADLKPLRDRFAETWQSIQEKVAAVVSWIADNVKPLIESAFNGVMAALDGFLSFWRANGDSIIAIVTGLWDTVTGIFSAAWAVLSGVVRAGIALLHGDFSGAGKILADTVRGWWAGVKQSFGGLAQAFGGVGAIIKTSIVDPMLNVGAQIVAGIQSGVMSAWNGMKTWLANKFADLPLIAKKILGIASPSKEFAEIGENIVAGMELGLQGIKQIGDWIQKEMVGWVKDKDLENFGSIATLTKNLVDIFENTTKALKSLLSFDVSTSAAQISAQFKALVGTFQTALLEMKTLAQYAGSGAPKNKEIADAFLNFFDIQNIELVSKGFEATISLINGLLDIAAKLQTVKVPSASDIEALLEPMSKLGDVAARFIHSVGKPEGEDATAYFQNGANTTAALASWAKSIADVVGIKFGAVSAEFASQMEAAAGAAADAWAAVKDTALAWGQIQSTTREQLITGIQAYATAVGAAVSILKGVAELKIDVATLATKAQMSAAAQAAADAAGIVGTLADWWIRAGEKITGPVVDGIKAFADAAGAAVGLLKSAADMDLSGATVATIEQLTKASDNARLAEILLRGLANLYVNAGAEWREKVVPAMKDYADSAGAALRLLADAAGIASEWAASSVIPADMLTVAAINAERARIVVQQLAERWSAAGDADGMEAVVAAVKGWTDTAGAALKALADAAGIAANFQESGVIPIQSLIYAAINATRAREVVQRLAEEWAKGKDDKAMAGTAAAIKAWGDVSGSALKALADAADGIAKLSEKLTIPADLGDKVAQLVAAMRIVVGGMAEALTGPGALSADVAKAGADVAEAVGRIGEAFGPIFDAINAAIESPFGRIKATGQRGDTFRQNIANRIKASLVAAVTALSEALGSMPAITIPDGLSEQIDKLAGIYDRILDVIGKLDGVKIDTRAVASLAAALGVLAGGVGGIGAGNITVTGGGSQLSVASGPGGGIVINNEFNPTLTPLPITINTTNNISVSGKVVESIATEVQRLEELKLRQGGTP